MIFRGALMLGLRLQHNQSLIEKRKFGDEKWDKVVITV